MGIKRGFKDNELKLIIGLLNFKSSSFKKQLLEVQDNNIKMRGFKIATDSKYSSEGWLPASVLCKIGDYKSSNNTFPTYKDNLVRKGIIEQKKIKYIDSRQRKAEVDCYRLKKDKTALQALYDEAIRRRDNSFNLSILTSSDYYKSLASFPEIIKLQCNSIEKTSEKSIKEYEFKIKTLKNKIKQEKYIINHTHKMRKRFIKEKVLNIT